MDNLTTCQIIQASEQASDIKKADLFARSNTSLNVGVAMGHICSMRAWCFLYYSWLSVRQIFRIANRLNQISRINFSASP